MKNNKKKLGNVIIILCIVVLVIIFEIITYYLFFDCKNNNDYETKLVNGINNIYDSVVVVEKYNKNKVTGSGSGFIYSKEGYIITNQHVIEDADEIKIIFSSGEKISASIVGNDEFEDIGILKIDKNKVKKVATIGDSKKIKLGETVFTVGSPIDSTYAGTITRGILSGKDRMVSVSVSSNSKDWLIKVLQTDASINPGNSGGPLCNINGEVIGVNIMKVLDNDIEGMSFAIPIEDALEYANNIINGINRTKIYVGISMADLSNSTAFYNTYIDESVIEGVFVMKSIENGPCYKGGIAKGDVITKINNTKVKNVAEFRYNLYKYKPNDKVQITYMRKDKEITTEIVLEEG